MPFPTTSVLTNFTGSEDPLSEGGNFAGPILPGMAQMKKVSGQAKQSTLVALQSGSSYWNAATFGPGVEAYATIPTWWNNASSDFWLWTNGNAENTSGVDGYMMALNNAGTWQLHRFDNNVGTQVGANLGTQVVGSGDSVGVEVIAGGTHQAYYKASGGSWATLGSTRSDNTYTSGHIGLSKGYQDTTSVVGDFGGGTIVAAGVSYSRLERGTRGIGRGILMGAR
jgi:hypothetical protein